MSALLPQIKSHRAMAQALSEVAAQSSDQLIAQLVGSIANAHRAAADALEAGQSALMHSLDRKPEEVEYRPKGRA